MWNANGWRLTRLEVAAEPDQLGARVNATLISLHRFSQSMERGNRPDCWTLARSVLASARLTPTPPTVRTIAPTSLPTQPCMYAGPPAPPPPTSPSPSPGAQPDAHTPDALTGWQNGADHGERPWHRCRSADCSKTQRISGLSQQLKTQHLAIGAHVAEPATAQDST
jgi:hypothetical protein